MPTFSVCRTEIDGQWTVAEAVHVRMVRSSAQSRNVRKTYLVLGATSSNMFLENAAQSALEVHMQLMTIIFRNSEFLHKNNVIFNYSTL